MNILVITDLYPVRENEKNTPKTIKNFVECWQKEGHEVQVIKPNFLLNSFVRKKPFYNSGIYGNVENINYFFPFWGNIKDKIRTTLPACNCSNEADLGSQYRTGNMYLSADYNDYLPPCVALAHMPSGEIFANKLGLDFIAGVHVSDLEVLTNPLYSIYFKTELEKAHKNAKKIACRSEVLKNKFLKLYPQYKEKTFVCYSGINENYITKRLWKPDKKVKVLTCANLIRRKNIDKVIRECEYLDVELRIIGDGKDLKRLKSISQKPVFLGRMEHEQVLAEMRKADIFVLPSINETFGMVYLEAMASGCITVCTENDGIAGIIENNENGFFWKDGIIEEIINSHNQQEILNNSYKTILNYTSEKAAKNYLNSLMK